MRRHTTTQVLVAGLLTTGLAAQFYTTDAGVQSPALPSVRERIEWRSRRDAESWVAETRLVYSPLRELELDLTVPLVARHVDGVGGRSAQEGLGDIVCSGKLALVRDDDVMCSNRLAVLLDVSLPTGDDDGTIDGQDFGRRAAIGLGTVGVGAGLGGTIVRDRHRAAVAARFWQFAADRGFEPGSVFEVDVAWWYRLTPSVFAPHGDEVEVRLVAEALGRQVADDRRAGNDAGNGGHELRLVVGLQANVTPAFALELGVVVPLAETTSSPFGDERLGGLFSCRMSF